MNMGLILNGFGGMGTGNLKNDVWITALYMICSSGGKMEDKIMT
jgi:hypothetical protein